MGFVLAPLGCKNISDLVMVVNATSVPPLVSKMTSIDLWSPFFYIRSCDSMCS